MTATARLHGRLVGFLERRKRPVVANVAVARELAGWLLAAGDHAGLTATRSVSSPEPVVAARGSTRDAPTSSRSW
ncbi:hypothetical protein [Mycolicibacterium moriokaense]|uniref:hypothetical protein n=1 Tax=Mycolicibacterium moriokaense TaxID=39691 RepID=UPI001F3B695B|nr:hypothetical protein [Mycolicibacterium moriokaense]